MTTTTDKHTSPASPIKSTKGGLSIKRIFSTQGENALDSVDWERRDAVIKNPQGESVFEQKDVEFPKDWSPLATNVVASKYFYGDQTNVYLDPDEGGREYSLRQLIHRVTRTITDWGHKQGYFSTQQDAECFYDELTWLCVNQHGSFNSPVWFNVGLHDCYGVKDSGDRTIWGWDPTKQDIADVDPYEYPQGSACFIISVEDSIDDIWKLMSESARLFKFGSGVGADWSTLRSTHEKLSGGGIPSGPVSFMRVQDATGGTIKSGGKTRRAAIMQTLKVWHPDVMEFIDAKKTEEKKAWALIEQGYDGSFNGPAYGSVAFQNVNQSVRVNDEFMHSAESGTLFALRKVTTDEDVTEVDARMVLDRIADGTHICGDPGMQYEDTIQRWHTCKTTGPINSSNPCSEYMFLDNSACNLASLNLRKFQQEDGSFDVERFRAAVRVFITAMEIIVDNAGYPSESIARNSHLFRPLGLGFANLGALLMAMGLPYDSDEGRAVAGAIMAIEHAEAYARSAEIAANPRIGPFEGYEENRESMLNVMRMHRDAADEIDQSCPGYLLSAAKESLDRMVALGECHGYRNSQVTVLAPTGTIAFMMDCDTTGIEPDIALVKYKLLAGKGDGTLKIINHTVPEALARLGYDEEQIESILNYVSEHDTIEGAPELDEAHLPVFDCAFKPFKGTRSVHSMGHIRMMAACQPFVSGAISKTVNMPEEVTVDEIGEAYMEGWRLGL
ncbi:MAG: vitamin B12-dependent ribonucleotide reductase, partial [Rhodothermaceae bacterium]|nr:vitamin B12-dependent ribonucleotide reductase [Rhodothermaceae bacterium]